MMRVQLEKNYTYDELITIMDSLVEENKRVLNKIEIGQSNDERPIYMLSLGFGEKSLICTAGVHGRETINPVLLLSVIEEYVNAYWNKEWIGGHDVFDLLHTYSINFIPVLNPDGYVIATEGFRKINNPNLRHAAIMMNVSHEFWKYNGRGVDINRNFAAASYVQQRPCEYPNSEPETRALIQVFHDADSIAYIDFHSRGRIIYYYRNSMSNLYNLKQHRLAKYIQEISNYELGRKEEELLSKAAGGNTVHYYSENFEKPAITVETISEDVNFPIDNRYQMEAFSEIHTIPLALLDLHYQEIFN